MIKFIKFSLNKKIKKYKNSYLLKTFITFVDQGLLSATNFLLGIIIIKQSTKYDYGLYVVAYSFIMLAIGLQNALINIQVTVIAPKKKRKDLEKFTYSLYLGQYLYWIPFAIIIIAVNVFLYKTDNINYHKFILITLTTTTTFFFFLREYNRTLSFLKLKPINVLIQDILYIFGLFGTFYVFKVFIVPEKPTFLLAIFSIGVSALIISLIMSVIYFNKIVRANSSILSSISECWINGKWSLLSGLVGWIETQSYVYLLPLLKSLEDTASANAARQFFMPVVLLSISFGRIFRPKWAVERHENKHNKILSDAKKVVFILISIILVYSILIAFVSRAIIPIIYTVEYKDSIPYILIWALYFSLSILVTNSSTLLQVYEKFKHITQARFISALVTIIIAIILILKIGGIGSIVAMCIGRLFLFIFLHKKVSKEIQ